MTNIAQVLHLTHGAFIFDNSLIEDWIACPTKANYKDFRRRTRSQNNSALSFGSAIHLALDYRYSKYADLSDLVDLAICENNQKKLLEEFFRANPIGDEEHRDLNWAIELMQQYNQRYTVEPFNLLQKNGRPLVEQSFALPFAAYHIESGELRRIGTLTEVESDEIPIVFSGKIDLPCQYGDEVYVGDHKTASTMGDQFWKRQRVNPQFIGYCWAWWRLTGQRPMGFLVNAIRTQAKPIKPRSSWDQWWEECFSRNKEVIDEEVILDWESNTLLVLEEIFWQARRGEFARHRQNCMQYGTCLFYDVCFSKKESQEELLNGSMFEPYTWSPLIEHKEKFESL